MQIIDRTATAALIVLIILQAIMLTSLYAGVAPHPPASTPLFGMGPFIGASVAIAAAALVTGATISGAGRALAIPAALAALVSFGPQKYADAQFALIWPAVLTAQAAIIALAGSIAVSARTRQKA